MNDQASATPLVELLRSIPKDLRAEWEIQWFEDGTPSGHAMAPVGKHAHDAAEQIKQLQSKNDRLNDELNTQNETLEQLEAKCEKLAEGLCFYADPDSYFAISILTDPPCGGFAEDTSEVDSYDREMPGRIARETLKRYLRGR